MSGGAVVSDEQRIIDKYKSNEGDKLWPHPMLQKMEEADKILFPKEKVGKFNSYSSSCQVSQNKNEPKGQIRRPVILTKDEYENIYENHRDTYTESISYSSGKNDDGDDKNFWYICPRYFGLLENRSLSESEVATGEFGKIIPNIGKKLGIPPNMGYNIMEFNKDHLYPGFMEPSKHAQGKCMPCCYKTWDNDARVKTRKKCMDETKIGEKEQVKKTSNYIEKGHPLNEGVQGYIDPRILELLGINNRSCEEKSPSACFLRRGVVASNSQSLLLLLRSLKKKQTSCL